MKIKKYLTALLLSVAGVCTAFAFGCVEDEEEPNGHDPDVPYVVTFQSGDNFKYLIGDEEVEEKQFDVVSGSKVEFSLVIDEGYYSPVVKANGTSLSADNEGNYSYTVVSDVTITASVSVEPAFTLSGEGTSESPYLIQDLKGLKYVAQMVNAGSPTYVLAYYRLENDIDCGGANLDIIGDLRTNSSYFGGNFDGNGKTVSNFKIDHGLDAVYVGLFGCVQGGSSTDSGVIQNLNLSNFNISASARNNGNVCVGAFVGYLAGANLVACSATDGTVNAHGSTYFSYSGGAVGIQQTVTLDSEVGPVNYLSSVDYVHTDVEIINTGYVFASGGVVGYAYATNEMASATVVNSYAEGQIQGAMRTGGVVGWLGEYSAIANCYSTGFLSAYVEFSNIKNEDPEYFAYAGGLAGYASVGTVITDSFSKSGLEASEINSSTATDEICAGVAEAPYGTAFTYDNCYYGNSANATSAYFVYNNLKWNDLDWVIANGKLPVTNLSTTQANNFKVTLDYGTRKVGGEGTKEVTLSITSSNYLPFAFYLGETLGNGVIFSEYVLADSGETSFGYFFDSACTKKVPNSYVLTKPVTLYVNFADYSEVAGYYYYTGAHGRNIKVELDTNGVYRYVDVASTSGTKYVYDGETIIFKNAIFARLSENIATSQVNGSTVYRPDLNYNASTFVGKVEGNVLKVYDGSFFTESNALEFTKTAPTVSANADFVGVWEKSASLNERYEFKANGTWTYNYRNNATKSGNYTVNQGGVATLSGGISATATIDASGLLSIDGEFYRLKNSYNGVWYSPSTGAYLSLNGYGNLLMGNAIISVDGRVYSGLSYVKDGFFDELTGNENDTFTILTQFALFGYFEYENNGKVISAHFYDGNTYGFIDYTFYLLDNFEGEWIGEGKIDGRPFTIANFNGLGIYKNEGGSASLGYVEINGQKVKVEYEYVADTTGSYDGNLSYTGVGKFTYNNVEYTLTYNSDDTITISDGTHPSVDMERKDIMYDMPLVDAEGTVYRFNGGGYLNDGGELTLTDTYGTVTTYGYKIIGGTVNVVEAGSEEDSRLDIFIHVLDVKGGTRIGTIQVEDVVKNGLTEKGSKFEFKLNTQSTATKLDLYLPFANKEWAINGMVNLFRMGNFDLSYEAVGSFNGTNNVPFVYFPEYKYILVQYQDNFEGWLREVRIYLLLLNDGNIAVSSYPYISSNDNVYYASPKDELFGTWINTSNSGYSLEFDGLADSMYTQGIAFDIYNGITFRYTRRFGKIYMWKYDDESIAYVVTRFISPVATGDNIFVLEGSSIQNKLRIEEFDVLDTPICVATDKDGVEYNFGFDGSITFGDRNGTYTLDSVDGDITTVTITDGDEKITVMVDHSTANATVTVAE